MSDRQKKKTKKKKVSWITIWLIAVVVIFSGVVGYATYTGVNVVKRVVSTKAGGGLLFSSNYMTTGTLTSIEHGDYADYYDEVNDVPLQTNPEYSMIVCNFSQGDKASWYTSSDIRFNVKAELFLNDRYTAAEAEEAGDATLAGQYKTPTSTDLGTKQFGIKHSGGEYTYFSADDLTIDLPDTYTLSKLNTSTDEFFLLFDKSELLNAAPSFWIKVTATPTTIVGGEVERLEGYVGACQIASGEATWTGSIGDSDYRSTDYDAYNYIIAGSGKGTFYFAWDDDMVKPNEFALLNYGSGTTPLPTAAVSDWTDYSQYGASGGPSAVTGADTWKCIVLSVDSGDLPRYEFQLYKMYGTDYRTVIDKYVDYKFVAAEED